MSYLLHVLGPGLPNLSYIKFTFPCPAKEVRTERRKKMGGHRPKKKEREKFKVGRKKKDGKKMRGKEMKIKIKDNDSVAPQTCLTGCLQ